MKTSAEDDRDYILFIPCSDDEDLKRTMNKIYFEADIHNCFVEDDDWSLEDPEN